MGCLLLDQWHRAMALRNEHDAASAAVASAEGRNQQLTANVKEFQDLLDRHTSQKEQVVREIAEFQRELELLTRRTQGLERVRDDLKALDGEFARFRRAEDEFTSNLARLEEAVKEGRP